MPAESIGESGGRKAPGFQKRVVVCRREPGRNRDGQGESHRITGRSAAGTGMIVRLLDRSPFETFARRTIRPALPIARWAH